MSLYLVSDEGNRSVENSFVHTLCFDVNLRGKVPRRLLDVPRPIVR